MKKNHDYWRERWERIVADGAAVWPMQGDHYAAGFRDAVNCCWLSLLVVCVLSVGVWGALR